MEIKRDSKNPAQLEAFFSAEIRFLVVQREFSWNFSLASGFELSIPQRSSSSLTASFTIWRRASLSAGVGITPQAQFYLGGAAGAGALAFSTACASNF